MRFGVFYELQLPKPWNEGDEHRLFREALDHYETTPFNGKVTLFRPKLDESYKLGRGRFANAARLYVDHYNFWKPHALGGIDLHIVPGDHDSMVLEPNVRSLAAKLRLCLEDAQGQKPEAPEC